MAQPTQKEGAGSSSFVCDPIVHGRVDFLCEIRILCYVS